MSSNHLWHTQSVGRGCAGSMSNRMVAPVSYFLGICWSSLAAQTLCGLLPTSGVTAFGQVALLEARPRLSLEFFWLPHSQGRFYTIIMPSFRFVISCMLFMPMSDVSAASVLANWGMWEVAWPPCSFAPQSLTILSKMLKLPSSSHFQSTHRKRKWWEVSSPMNLPRKWLLPDGLPWQLPASSTKRSLAQ